MLTWTGLVYKMIEAYQSKQYSQGIKRRKRINAKMSLWELLVVQWLRLRAFTAEGTGLIPTGEPRFHKLGSMAKIK